MTTIARVTPASPHDAGVVVTCEERWDAIAVASADWARGAGVSWRDAVVIVPFVELLAPARRAFARLGIWMPRIETTRTLAASLGPPTSSDAQGSFDAALDGLVATQLLARERWGAEWMRRDRRGFEHAAQRVAATARDLARAASTLAPTARADWWQSARDALDAVGGAAAGLDKMLARVAVEWAASAPEAATDRLFRLRPSAWIAVQAGGADPLAMALLAHGDAPALVVDADAPLDRPFEGIASALSARPPAHALCDGFEDEAWAAAAQVLDHLGRGERPVALVALDRVLVRRVRALLERAGARIADETGWKMSTTRAGASVMSLLQAARPTASADAYLDWLKSLPPDASAEAGSLGALEALCRRRRLARRDAIGADALTAGAARLHVEASSTLDELAAPSRRGLTAWLEAVQVALERWGVLARLRDDEAGRQALAALGVDPPLAATRRASLSDGVEPLTLAEFTRWVDDVLERVTFRPGPADAADAPDVVVTPLARTMLRPFAAVVIPGADSRSLGALPFDDTLLPPGVAAALALPTAASRRDAELLAFAQALRLPRVTISRRRGDGGDPVTASAFVERFRSALAELRTPDGRPGDLRPWRDPRGTRRVAAEPVVPSAPAVPAHALPSRLSASAFEALRACPYRFFAERVLKLTETEELDDEVEKRDYGTWLHDVLDVFHRERAGPRDAAADVARLREIGEEVRAAMGIDAAAFLPYDASFAGFVPRYVTWLHARERSGWHWQSGESETRRAPAELGGLELYGVIDRIDRREGKDGPVLELIDYKTGSAEKLKEKVREPLEDTQLAFYAALVGDELPVTASYLAIDRTQGADAGRASARRRRCAQPRGRPGRRDEPPARRHRPARARRGQRLRLLPGAGPVPARPLGAPRRWPVTRPRCASTAGASSAEAFYAAACDPSRSCVVEACAGSGKTWMLVSRMLRALLDGAAPHEILAITFTRAAAGEMRERLDQWLADFSTPRSTHEERVRALVERGVDAARAEALAPELGGLQARVLGGRAPSRDPYLPWLVRAAAAVGSARAARPARRAGRRRARGRLARAPHGRAPRFPRRASARRGSAGRSCRGDGRGAAATSCACGSMPSGTGASSSSWPTRRASSRRASSAPRTSGPSSRPTPIRPSRSPPRPGTSACGAAARELVSARGKLARDAGEDLATALSLAPNDRFAAAWSTLFTATDDKPRGPGSRPAAGRRGAERRSQHLAAQVHQHESRDEHLRMVRLGRALLAALAELQARAGVGGHGRPRARRARPPARRRAVRLGPGAARCPRLASAGRRVPGHQPAPVARAARLARGLRRRRRRRERPAAAGRLHRRRPEAEHLSVPPRRAARVRGRGGVRARRARRQPARLRPHPSQRAARDRGDQRRVPRRRRRVPGLSPSHHEPSTPTRRATWRC